MFSFLAVSMVDIFSIEHISPLLQSMKSHHKLNLVAARVASWGISTYKSPGTKSRHQGHGHAFTPHCLLWDATAWLAMHAPDTHPRHHVPPHICTYMCTQACALILLLFHIVQLLSHNIIQYYIPSATYSYVEQVLDWTLINWIWSSLLQTMAFRLFDAKPLFEQTYIQSQWNLD